ncbi:MAG: T9SS type A sorting domain-containing protein [Saprospiraceae bacterium]|nr:T9SS type A sorting domain-containing protein [Saprospiraceae bacterium]
MNFSRKPSDGIAIYPNPAIQMVHLDISTMDAAAGEIDLRIYDIHGRIMADKTIIGAGIEPIDVTQYPTGTYNISVTQGNTQHQKRFIKIE